MISIEIPTNYFVAIPHVPTIPYVLEEPERPYTVGLIVQAWPDNPSPERIGHEIAWYNDIDPEFLYTYEEDNQLYYFINIYSIVGERDLNETYIVSPETE